LSLPLTSSLCSFSSLAFTPAWCDHCLLLAFSLYGTHGLRANMSAMHLLPIAATLL
jgi:hypothetical protein